MIEAAGRDPNTLTQCHGSRGGIWARSDRHGAFPHHEPCGPQDLHATIFQALGIPLDSVLHDRLGRPHQLTDGHLLPLLG